MQKSERIFLFVLERWLFFGKRQTALAFGHTGFPGPPKAAPRSTQGFRKHSLFHLCAQMLGLFCVCKKLLKKKRRFFIFLRDDVFSDTFRFRPVSSEHPKESFLAPRASQGRPKERPRPPKTLPFSPLWPNASAVWRLPQNTKRRTPFFSLFLRDAFFLGKR